MSHFTAKATILYDVLDAAYCCAEMRALLKNLGRLPLIGQKRHCGEKLELNAAMALRYNQRTVAARIK